VFVSAVATATSAGSAAGTGATVPTVGVVTDLTWGVSRAEMDRTVGLLVAAGVRSVRLSVSWSAVEQDGKGVLNTAWLAELDAAIQKARNAGLQVLIPIADGVPYWASADPAKTGGSWNKLWKPTSMSDYGDFVDFVVSRYSSLGVTSYEIWNEPNHPRFWPSGVDAVDYTTMLRAGSDAVRRANPAAKVVLGGLAKSDAAYMSALYAAGAGPLFDIAAIHPYTGSVSPTQCWVDASGVKAKDAFCGIEAVRDVMVAKGDSAKEMWLTELGWSTSTAAYGVTEAQQASYLTDAYTWLSSRPYVTVTFWYQSRNVYWLNDDPTDLEANYGLWRTDYAAKPAWASFQAVAASQVPPGATTSTNAASTTTPTTAPATSTTLKRKRGH